MADGSKVSYPKSGADINVKIERSGTKIILPADPKPELSYRQAIEALERVEKDENEEFTVIETIDGYHFLDGAVAFWKAIVKKYGFASPEAKMTFFGKQRPSMLTVQTGPNPADAIQVPWGKMAIPGFDKPVETYHHETPDDRYIFGVRGTLKRKNVSALKDLMQLAREIVSRESIYRGKAVQFPTDGRGIEPPVFINTLKQAEEELILNRDIADLVTVNVWTPIRHTDACRAHSIPLKRGVLLEGMYGTGKSLTGAATARICEESGWTFILLENVSLLAWALKMARHYAPAVVFAEDIDRVLSKRDNAGNELINTIDGVIGKDNAVITILTTNFADKLDKAMLRPGRLDTVISYTPPDSEAVQRLIRLYARGLIADGASLGTIGKALAGQIPATVREVVERSKLAMISRGADTISEEDLLLAANGMRRHLDFLNGKPEPDKSAVEKFGEALVGLMLDSLDEKSARLELIEEKAGQILDQVA